MGERSTSPSNSSPTSKEKAFRKHFRADTHPNKLRVAERKNRHDLTPYELLVGRKPQGVRKHCECTHPEQKPIEARHEVGEMYPHRILVWEKGIQVLQPFDPSSSGKWECSIQQIGIMVQTLFNSIWPDRGRVECQLRWWYSTKSSTKGQ